MNRFQTPRLRVSQLQLLNQLQSSEPQKLSNSEWSEVNETHSLKGLTDFLDLNIQLQDRIANAQSEEVNHKEDREEDLEEGLMIGRFKNGSLRSREDQIDNSPSILDIGFMEQEVEASEIREAQGTVKNVFQNPCSAKDFWMMLQDKNWLAEYEKSLIENGVKGITAPNNTPFESKNSER